MAAKEVTVDNKAMDTKLRKDVKFTNYANGVAIVSAPFYLQDFRSGSVIVDVIRLEALAGHHRRHYAYVSFFRITNA